MREKFFKLDKAKKVKCKCWELCTCKGNLTYVYRIDAYKLTAYRMSKLKIDAEFIQFRISFVKTLHKLTIINNYKQLNYNNACMSNIAR